MTNREQTIKVEGMENVKCGVKKYVLKMPQRYGNSKGKDKAK